MGVFVIAEAGVNHNGSLERALRLVDTAVTAGADAVKFQTFSATRLATQTAPKANYQTASTDAGESQFAMLRRLELSAADHHALKAHCIESGIEFLSSPFDVESLRFLIDDLGVARLKLGSGELTNGPLLLAAARSGKEVILSTGMSTLAEVKAALEVMAFGMLHSDTYPTGDTLEGALDSAAGQEALTRRVRLLHCTSEYPAQPEDVNLRAMATLSGSFGLPVGLSDHTPGIAVSVAAAALGATIIEKHFTLDRSLPGPDHKASLEPPELLDLVTGVRAAKAALGSPLKRVAASEEGNRGVARKSLVAARAIRAGEPFTEANLTVKRPGTGLSPMRYWQLLGQPAPRAFAADELIIL